MGSSNRVVHVDGYAHPVIEAGEGPLVLCLHGFPDNNETFANQIGPLVAAGYRVVCPMLPGYAPDLQQSAGPTTPVSACDDVLSLAEFLLAEMGQEKCHLVGHDWGALVAYLAANKNPELVKSLTSLSIPYNVGLSRILLRCPSYLLNAWYVMFFQLVGVAEFFVRRNDYAFIGMLYRSWCPAWKDSHERIASATRTLSQPSALRGALGYYRNSLVGLSRASFRFRSMFNDEIHVPTLALRGVDDRCVPEVAWEQMSVKSFRAGLFVKSLEGASHFPQWETPGLVNDLLIRWITEFDS